VRLYPAFWACCTITFLATVAFGGSRFHATPAQYVANMTLLSGFTNVRSIDGVYWSLAVELQFYALVAAALWMDRIRNAQALLVLWLIASIALELRPVWPFRSLLLTDYAAFFIGGAECYLIWSRGPSLGRATVVVVAWLLAIVESLRGLPSITDHYHTSMNAYVVSALVSGFFSVMALVSLRLTGVPRQVPWVFVGVITYPLYLLHQVLGYLVFNAAYPALNPHVLFWSAIVGVIALACLVHVGVERPLAPVLKRLLDDRLPGERRTVAIDQRSTPFGDVSETRLVR
jgi:peptidoglycan/LPS O-acetylase OafA/YrhL